MEDKVKISIIVVGYNGKVYLHDCISSLLDQETNTAVEIIYVDNCSSDGSVDYVKSKFYSVKTVSLTENKGYYEAFNFIAKNVAIGEYLIALPQDTILHKKCLQELERVADSDDNIKICLVNTVYPGCPDFIRMEREKWIDYVYLMGTTRLGVTLLRKKRFSKTPIPILAYSGVSALLKRNTFEKEADFFDTKISHFLGDVDIGIRANVLGKKVILVPTAIIYHVEDNKQWSSLQLLYRSYLGARDTYLVYYKNMTLMEFLIFVPFLILGIPTKVFTLRTSWLTKVALFTISLFLSPIVFITSLLNLNKVSSDRKNIVTNRKCSKFWLIKTVVFHRLN